MKYTPLFGSGYEEAAAEWDRESEDWANGIFPSYVSDESRQMTYKEWAGSRPCKDDYMPSWDESEKTHFMMYETTSEGTPISPAFSTPQELARWLAAWAAAAWAAAAWDDVAMAAVWAAQKEMFIKMCNGEAPWQINNNSATEVLTQIKDLEK